MRVADAVGTFAMVFILPEDVNITSGSPKSHRNFMDIYLSQISKPYLRNLIEYQKVLKQRNALLKKLKTGGRNISELDAWDDLLVGTGLKVMATRRDFVNEISPFVSDFSGKLSGARDKVVISYLPRIQSEDYGDPGTALNVLRENRSRELRVGASLTGPHRDMLGIIINGYPLRPFGSLGQKKTVMLAMKLAALEMLSKYRGERAILIMDEAFAELDRERGRSLLGLLSGGGQVFLASATMGGMEKERMVVFEVVDGVVSRRES